MTVARRQYAIRSGGEEVELYEPPSRRTIARLSARRPSALAISRESGWRGETLEFLERLPFVRELTVVDLRINDVSGVGRLTKLKRLRLFTYATGPLDLSGLRALEEAAIVWNHRFAGLSGCGALKKLHVERLTAAAMPELATLRRLMNLDIMHTLAPDFRPVWALHRLKKLRIALAPYLTDREFRGVSKLLLLKQLILQTCRRITTLAPLAKCSRLQKVVIEDCGEIASLGPLKSLQQLRELALPGTTNVRDGDLSIVTGLPRLVSFAGARRRHYRPSVREIEEVVRRRGR
jgi:hypothetical protein